MDPLEYVMNRMEVAAQSSNPAEMGYGDARRELICGIESLRSRLALAEKVVEAAKSTQGCGAHCNTWSTVDNCPLCAALRAYDAESVRGAKEGK